MKNVLYISYDGMTDPLGQSQVLPYLIGLAKEGYNITLLSCEKPEKYENNENLILGITQANKIIWVPLLYTKKPPVLSTLWDILKLKATAFKLHKRTQFDIVHCRSYIPALIGLEMKKKFSCKFIFDMRGFWADERVEGNLWNLKNPLYKAIYNYFKRKEVEFLENADYTVSLTESAKQEIQSWNIIKNNPINIQVIPCCVDTELFSIKKFKKEEILHLREQLEISEEDYILSYLGAIGTWYMLDEMLDFFKRLMHKKPNSKFLFITAENHSTIIDKAVEKEISQDRIIIKKAERNEVPKYLALCDASIFFIKPVYSKKASSPTKQGELMSMGIPVVCNAGIGDTDYVIEKYNSGFLSRNFNNSAYDEIVENLGHISEEGKEKIRNGAINTYSLEEGIKKYLQIYNMIS